MGLGDKLENAKDKVVGQVKETVGGATNNADLEAEGKGQQAKGSVKDAAENVKDAFKG
ncbi:CsbD family protein [Galactobacter caseinivorans]|uniref:CsbD family protein n=1 Tax=Galactobacter caseinivorans TaxID=2676123 RepID=A0A496PHJ7_9MICC|nr:CsbD family protein [Galactobacter caseinivorans]RKW69963.1 CsbD family protein [Galactobacter caseinivorans]